MTGKIVCYVIGYTIGLVIGLVVGTVTMLKYQSVCVKINIRDDNDETKNANNKTKDATDNNVGDKEEKEA